MHFFASALLLGSVALQSVLGRPSLNLERDLIKRSVDDWISFESPIALEQLLCNIGSTGCHASGVSSGIVIASPDKSDPDCKDSALVFKAIVERFTNTYDAGLQTLIQQYIASQAKLQGVSNPSGSLSDGSGLGEAKYYVDMSPYTGGWGRPQRDGPALRAIAITGYAKWLVNNGYSSTASNVLWPIIRNDLNYVTQYWNRTGFDLWEEVSGSSFFTIASQYRGTTIATQLGKSSDAYSAIAPQILCFLQKFWLPSSGYIDANINVNDGRTGKDANTILASIHNFDPSLSCDDATFQPCSQKALANLKQVVDSFRFYAINSGISAGTAIAIGRYSEDTYYNGNPWYLNTLAVAEQLYDAIYVWKKAGSITVSSTSLAFFKDLSSSVTAGTYASSSTTYQTLLGAASTYADGFVNIVSKYASSNGSIAEQYSKSNGTPLSADDLTWSYAAFLTAAARRAGIVPPSWAASVPSVPGTCVATSIVGSYSSATSTSFPTSQTPISGTVAIPTSTGTRTSTTSATSCAIASTVSVTFNSLSTTSYGDTIKIVGSIAALGSWNTANAIALSASDYTSSNPLWKVTIALPAGQAFEYKYINVKSSGTVTWEKDPNRSYTVPKTCATTATKQDTWQS
ncbi:putative glucoamylase GMY1 [Dactylonectria estremocensis]|uniref:Glucoamylase n=1 Tax=Dactylonectria estremocensis TaxID=1079267 RepID=A0A9P9F703_9HYPO|nr:putative glucoamylase GMY1 [Dactylonectria estremocensis]